MEGPLYVYMGIHMCLRALCMDVGFYVSRLYVSGALCVYMGSMCTHVAICELLMAAQRNGR